MRILQIAPQFPFPETDGGKTGIARLTEYYTKIGHTVHLFCVCKQEPSKDQLERAKLFTPHVSYIVADTHNSAKNILLNLFSSESLYTWKLNRANVKEALLRVAEEFHPDIVHADHTNTAPLAMFLQDKLGLAFGLRLHNVEWVIWHRYAETFPKFSPQRMYLDMQASRLRTFEAQAMKRAAVCFAITEQDKRRALELSPNAHIEVVSSGVDTEHWQPVRNVARVPHHIVLATNWDWVHNVHGVEWFVRHVLPLVQAEVPNVHLHLLGKNPPSSLHALDKELVTVHGFVDDIHTFLSKCGVYIAPLFVGSGIRLKILEAMAMELPVIATTIAAEGNAALVTDGLFVQDEATNMAKNLIGLIQQPAKAKSHGKSARSYIEKHHSWDENIRKMASLLEPHQRKSGK